MDQRGRNGNGAAAAAAPASGRRRTGRDLASRSLTGRGELDTAPPPPPNAFRFGVSLAARGGSFRSAASGPGREREGAAAGRLIETLPCRETRTEGAAVWRFGINDCDGSSGGGDTEAVTGRDCSSWRPQRPVVCGGRISIARGGGIAMGVFVGCCSKVRRVVAPRVDGVAKRGSRLGRATTTVAVGDADAIARRHGNSAARSAACASFTKTIVALAVGDTFTSSSANALRCISSAVAAETSSARCFTSSADAASSDASAR